MSTDWSSHYTTGYAVYEVNPDTWLDGDEVAGLVSVDISTDATDDTPMLETASFTFEMDISHDDFNGWYRLVAYVKQRNVTERYPLTTQLLESEGDNVSYGISTIKISGSSVLKPASDREMLPGTYVPAKSNGIDYITNLLEDCVPAPIVVEGSGFVLDDYLTFSSGTTYLKAIWMILDTANWCMQLDGNGVIYLRPKPDDPEFVFDRSATNILQDKIARTLDRSSVINQYIAIEADGKEEIAENTDPLSPVSIPYRNGRIVNKVDTSVKKIDGETLWGYARRKLEEASTVVRTYTYTREYIPGLYPFDIIKASLPNTGFSGDLRILSQKISCGESISVSETAGEEIKEFVA